MKRFFRLYGKKRGHRLSGWWLAGRAGEAFFYAILFAFGLLTLSTLVAMQLIAPDKNAFRIGYGFWLMVLLSSSFIGIGAVGFFYRVRSLVYSDEHRSVLEAEIPNERRSRMQKARRQRPMLPNLQSFTDSPGVRLAYRLPENRPETRQLFLASLFVVAWDALTVSMLGLAIAGLLRGKPSWFLLLVALPIFIYASYRITYWFVFSFRRATGIGPTTIEIDDLPLLAGKQYQLSLVQYGRLAVKKVSISLVCEEVATYHFGTDTRTERQEVYRQSVLEHGRCRIDWGRPLELSCSVSLPDNLMHSFQSPHNSITWKFVVEGEVGRWPSYCRSFPVVVYPREAQPTRHAVPL